MTGPLHATRRGHLRSLLTAFPLRSAFAASPQTAPLEDWSDPATLYTIPGLPQTKFDFQVQFAGARITPMRFRGTLGYVIEPTGRIDRERRWVWVSPMYLAIRSIPGGVRFQYYVESLA